MEEDARPAENPSPLNLPKRNKVLLIILSIIMTLSVVLTLSLLLYTWDRGQIATGVILDIPLGQLRIEEANGELNQVRNELYNRSVHFISDGQNFPITIGELGLTYSYDEPLQQAYRIGREGTLFDKAISKYKARQGITLEPEYQWNDLVLAETLAKHLSILNLPAEDAHFTITPDNSMQIFSEKIGKQVDIDSLMESVKKLALNQTEMFPIPFQAATPIITKTELENAKITGLLSSYTTHFDPNLKGRTQNIKLSAQSINGTVLKPNEEFSFNQTVGPRTSEAGYQMAIIIEGDKFVSGLGGGVCQTSSTLYNAVRLASLRVIERAHHSLTVTYVPPGQDATVAYPSLDFKFRNDSDGYLLIRSSVNNNTVTFSLYGNKKE